MDLAASSIRPHALVRKMGTYSLGSDNTEERPELILDPSWEAVEKAIRRLDGERFGGLRLCLNEEPRYLNHFHIRGGAGAYYFTYNAGGYHLSYTDSDAPPKDPSEGWNFDRNFLYDDRHRCRDLDLVLAAARTFFDQAEPLKEIRWSEFFVIIN